MKRKVFLALVVVLALLLSGCIGEDYGIRIHQDGTCDVTYSMMYEQSFYNELTQDDQFSESEMKDEGYSKSTKTYNNETYISFDKTVKCSSVAQMTKLLEDEQSFSDVFQNTESENKLNADGTINIGSSTSTSGESAVNILKADTSCFQGVIKATATKEEMEAYEEYGEGGSAIICFSVGFDNEITSTNGELGSDKKEASWIISDFTNDTLITASTKGDSVFTVDTTAPYSKTFQDGKYYNNNYESVCVTDNVGVASVTLNGVKVSPEEEVVKNGTYTLIAKDFAGNTSEITFYMDLKKPTIKLTKTTGKCTITYSDNLAVKWAALNGKSIESGTVITKKGTYTVKVKDKAGNISVKKFQIK